MNTAGIVAVAALMFCASPALASSGTLTTEPAGDRSPTTAFLLSLLIPGAGWGQYYNGEGGKGTMMLLAFAAGGVVAALEADDGGNIPDAPIGISLMVAAKLWSVIDAPLSSRRINSQRGARSAGSVSLGPGLCTLEGSPRPALLLTVGF